MNYFQYLRFTKSFSWSTFLFKKKIPISDFYCTSKKENKVYIRSVKHFFSPGDFPVFFEGYKTYCWKFLDSGFQFIFENNSMFVKINELSIKVETLEELFIINEVFLENIYNVESKSDYIVFDIGMNVAITALYLSQFDHIKKIYGFEPFKPTFDCAIDNINLNQKYTSKIVATNIGLSNSDQFVHLHFDPFNKGNVGIKNTLISEVDAKKEDRIELKEASKSLQKIMDEHPVEKFLVKLDCEGSEYDIIENLLNASLLPAFDVFMIEWHKMEGYKERLHHMINAFKENNFKVLTIGSLDSETGMIYCIHSN